MKFTPYWIAISIASLALNVLFIYKTPRNDMFKKLEDKLYDCSYKSSLLVQKLQMCENYQITQSRRIDNLERGQRCGCKTYKNYLDLENVKLTKQQWDWCK